MKENPLILFLGESSFPRGFAAIQRMTLMARALLLSGCRVLVVCRKGNIRDKAMGEMPLQGKHQGVEYIYTVNSPLRPKAFIQRNIQKFLGLYREWILLRKLKNKGGIAGAILSTHSSFHAFRYRIISKVLGFPLILNYVEHVSAMEHHKSLKKRLNDRIYDRCIVSSLDAALPISEFLFSQFRRQAPGKPLMKLPIICDSTEFNRIPTPGEECTFLYCGAASYVELVEFIITSFEQVASASDHIFLELIIGGGSQDVSKIKKRIESSGFKERIRLFNNIPRSEIPILYSRASALLIPLRPTVQDRARFPHKIGEYLASGVPIISTLVGEIAEYPFQDGKNSLIVEKYDTIAFSEKMEYVYKNRGKSQDIGLQGRKLGKDQFEYSLFSERLKHFILGIQAN